jgi:HEPN domain-containing protein
MKRATENWLKIARYDLKVADDNYKLENFITVVEKCHSSLEKLLKGIITENNQEPNKIHDLLRLSSEAMVTEIQ